MSAVPICELNLGTLRGDIEITPTTDGRMAIRAVDGFTTTTIFTTRIAISRDGEATFTAAGAPLPADPPGRVGEGAPGVPPTSGAPGGAR